MNERGECNGEASSNYDEYVAHKLAAMKPGHVVLKAVYDFLGRFISYPHEHAHVAHTLWIVHTHVLHAVDSTPRLCFLSPEPGSGKSRALEITALLVPANPVLAINVSAAYLFRRVGNSNPPPVVLCDEADTFFGPKATPHEEVRGLLNAGFRRGAVTGRCVIVGKQTIAQDFPAFAPVAMAGLGRLPDTIMSRAVIVNMRRRAAAETVEPYRQRKHEKQGFELRDDLAKWASFQWPEEATMGDFEDMPASVTDRDADVWECLLHIAKTGGADWLKRGKAAATAMVAEAHQREPTLGIRLLADLRAIFKDDPAMSTAEIIQQLCRLDESPWRTYRNGVDPINAERLARLLKPYNVSPNPHAVSKNVRGYLRSALVDPWNRYLPPPDEPAEPEEPAEALTRCGLSPVRAKNEPAAPAANRSGAAAGAAGLEETRTLENLQCHAHSAGSAGTAGFADADDDESFTV